MSVLIEVSGPQGSGKTRLVAKMIDAFAGKHIIRFPEASVADHEDIRKALGKADIVIVERQT